MLSRRRFIAAAGGLAAHPFHTSQRAFAQTIAKPARMLVGLAPGGGVDAVARLLVEHTKGYTMSCPADGQSAKYTPIGG